MMGALQDVMGLLSSLRSKPRQPWRLTGSLISSLALAGCSGLPTLPHVMYITVGSNPDQVIDSAAKAEVGARLTTLESGYSQIYPHTRFQFSLYPEDRISISTQRRNQAALGPDLLLVNGATALRLLEAGIVDPFPATPADLASFEPSAIARIRDKQGRLAGIPALVQTQVACFNRNRLAQAPTTMQELLEAGASGHPIGLSADVINLFWTAGSLGAVASINKIASGQAIDAQDRANLIRWMSWLQNANSQLRVTFFPDQQTVVSEFLAGRLDWIPCNSVSLPRLRQTIGNNLGVSALPDGEWGKASPVNRLRVLALGSSSNTAGRTRALAFSRFATNPLMQRALTVGSQTVLPANRFVMVPLQSSEILKAMDTSYQESQVITPALESVAVKDKRVNAVQAQLTGLLFGENSPELATEALAQLFRKQP
jgi:arabinogalactan oligomer / maltooligosaccharide transport system substrate-binding protein